MRILGIDPGTATMGIGVIETNGTKTFKHISHLCIRTEANSEPRTRLKKIYEELDKLIKKHNPDLVSIERLFFSRNAKTVMSISQVSGVVLLCAENNSVKTCEFTPLQVKLQITGYGRAEKRDIQEKVKKLLKLKETPKPDDAADALAIALCAARKETGP